MRRTAIRAVDTGNAGNLYVVSFVCMVMDGSALEEETAVDAEFV